MLQEEHIPACLVCFEWACGLRELPANSRSRAALARMIPLPCWYASLVASVFSLRGCQLKAGAWLLDPSLGSSLLAAWALTYICSQRSGCPQNNHWASVNLSHLYGKPARNYSLQLPTHTTPCFFTDTYPLTKITIKKPPREMYFWEPVSLTRCHCETYIINKSYAMAGFFFTIIRSVRGSILFTKADIL